MVLGRIKSNYSSKNYEIWINIDGQLKLVTGVKMTSDFAYVNAYDKFCDEMDKEWPASRTVKRFYDRLHNDE
jgi:hypothetical protein